MYQPHSCTKHVRRLTVAFNHTYAETKSFTEIFDPLGRLLRPCSFSLCLDADILLVFLVQLYAFLLSIDVLFSML
jgi:hypothetical protein